jgi:hypothetical protein
MRVEQRQVVENTGHAEVGYGQSAAAGNARDLVSRAGKSDALRESLFAGQLARLVGNAIACETPAEKPHGIGEDGQDATYGGPNYPSRAGRLRYCFGGVGRIGRRHGIVDA